MVHRDRRCQANTVSKEAGYLQSLPRSLQTAEAAVSSSAQLGICIAFAVTQQLIDGISCLAWLAVLLALLVSPRQLAKSAASCSTRLAIALAMPVPPHAIEAAASYLSQLGIGVRAVSPQSIYQHYVWHGWIYELPMLVLHSIGATASCSARMGICTCSAGTTAGYQGSILLCAVGHMRSFESATHHRQLNDLIAPKIGRLSTVLRQNRLPAD